MTRGYILNEINEIGSCGNVIMSYYVTWKVSGGITSQKWGPLTEFYNTLDEIEKCEPNTSGELPIERLIFYSQAQCFVYTRNPLWNCVEDLSEDSHVSETVPYITYDGKFGRIAEEKYCKNGVTQKERIFHVSEFMVGDWIYLKNLDCNTRVIQIRSTSTPALDTETLFPVLEENIGGIPLTDEILSKNGFEYHDENAKFFWDTWTDGDIMLRKKDDGSFMLVSVSDYDDEDVNETCFVIHYVHELQHIMRLGNCSGTIEFV